MHRTVRYGSTLIRYSVSRSARKTLAIEVHPDLSVRVIAPGTASQDQIRERVLKRAKWIRKQQHYFEEFLPRTPKREYVSGESHYYLGRRYVLRVRKGSEPSVKLKGQDLVVVVNDTHDAQSVKLTLAGWYYAHAQSRFHLSLTKALSRFDKYGIQQPPLMIRRMSRRWGSCTVSGKVILNPEIIKAPGRCIDYVINHELCHLVHHGHTPKFFALQRKMMPDWEKWKGRLERVMV